MDSSDQAPGGFTIRESTPSVGCIGLYEEALEWHVNFLRHLQRLAHGGLSDTD